MDTYPAPQPKELEQIETYTERYNQHMKICFDAQACLDEMIEHARSFEVYSDEGGRGNEVIEAGRGVRACAEAYDMTALLQPRLPQLLVRGSVYSAGGEPHGVYDEAYEFVSVVQRRDESLRRYYELKLAVPANDEHVKQSFVYAPIANLDDCVISDVRRFQTIYDELYDYLDKAETAAAASRLSNLYDAFVQLDSVLYVAHEGEVIDQEWLTLLLDAAKDASMKVALDGSLPLSLRRSLDEAIPRLIAGTYRLSTEFPNKTFVGGAMATILSSGVMYSHAMSDSNIDTPYVPHVVVQLNDNESHSLPFNDMQFHSVHQIHR
ncbi:hypothetical protein FJZ39_00960 [Candidatus Saccharibacteria bacterium]|nr:hypothetical protein [Candidatus Saccharibacteria bacterium]